MSALESMLGEVEVYTTANRGFTPEELANRAITKIISIGDKSHPLLREQAQAFKQHIYEVLVQYLQEAQESERLTLCCKLKEQGLEEIAELIRKL